MLGNVNFFSRYYCLSEQNREVKRSNCQYFNSSCRNCKLPYFAYRLAVRSHNSFRIILPSHSLESSYDLEYLSANEASVGSSAQVVALVPGVDVCRECDVQTKAVGRVEC